VPKRSYHPLKQGGIPASDLVRKTVTAVFRDDVLSTLLVLDDLFYVRDANDGCFGNPLRAGLIMRAIHREN
jgi:hypothetical protein